MANYDEIFSPQALSEVFPPERTNEFFDALFGDPDEGAYDIRLAWLSAKENTLNFLFELHQRGNACLACNLTYGLPGVFVRHPIINIKGVTAELARRAGWDEDEWTWEIGRTEEISKALHVIPLVLKKG